MDIYESHPKWKELESICSDIENLKYKAKELREEIDKDLFKKKKIKLIQKRYTGKLVTVSKTKIWITGELKTSGNLHLIRDENNKSYGFQIVEAETVKEVK